MAEGKNKKDINSALQAKAADEKASEQKSSKSVQTADVLKLSTKKQEVKSNTDKEKEAENAQEFVISLTQDSIEDEKELDACRGGQRSDVIDSKRLGIYTQDGTYVINSKITEELLSLPKILTKVNKNDEYRNFSDIYDLKITLPKLKTFNFRLIVTDVSSKLYIVENVVLEGGGYLEVHEEKIDQMKFAAAVPSEQELFLRFNIVVIDEETDEGKKQLNELEEEILSRMEEGSLDNIMRRTLYLEELSRVTKELTSGAEQKVFNEIMAYLKMQGEYGKKIIDVFVKRLEDRKAVFAKLDEKEKFKALNDVLIGALEVATTISDLEDQNIRVIFNKIHLMRAEELEKIYDNAKNKLDVKKIKKELESRKHQRRTIEAAIKQVIIDRQAMLKIKKAKEAEKGKAPAKKVQKPKKTPQKQAFKAAGGGGKGGGGKKGGAKKQDGGAPAKKKEEFDWFHYYNARKLMGQLDNQEALVKKDASAENKITQQSSADQQATATPKKSAQTVNWDITQTR